MPELIKRVSNNHVFRLYFRTLLLKLALVTRNLHLRHRLHGRGYKSTRFHDLETASKTTRFRSVYTKHILPFSKCFRTWLKASAAFCARFVMFTLRDPVNLWQNTWPFSNRCGFVVYTTNETVSFWKRSTFNCENDPVSVVSRSAPCKWKA